MSNQTFYILDVFAEQKYAGNQLAVIRNASDLTCEQMQKIAKEMNYSETTFILSDEQTNGGYDVRIFTPEMEIPFAGHPTIGTAYVIQKYIAPGSQIQINLNLKVGQIPVTFDKSTSTLWMKPKEPKFGQIHNTHQGFAEILSIDTDDIDTKFPIQTVSTGISFVFVPLKTLNAVKRAKINRDKLFTWLNNKPATGVFVFSPESYDPQNDINARMFADAFGVIEDPATGSANSCFAAYLIKHNYFNGTEIDITVEQGYEISRPSLLYLKAKQQENEIDVAVGGKVILTAKGQLV